MPSGVYADAVLTRSSDHSLLLYVSNARGECGILTRERSGSVTRKQDV